MTRNELDSAIAIGLPWRMRLPMPDGPTLAQADLQHVCLIWSGVLAGATAAFGVGLVYTFQAQGLVYDFSEALLVYGWNGGRLVYDLEGP